MTDDRNAEEMAAARLLHGKLLLSKEQKEEALKTLALVGSGASPSLRLEARLLQAKISEELGFWNRAAGTWEDLLSVADAVKGGKARVLYALGIAYSNGETPRWDRAAASWQDAFALGGDEGLAAGIRLGKLLLDRSQADADGALKIWATALADVGTPNDYHIQALDLGRAREILDAACQFFLAQKDYEHTRTAAELYKKIAPAGVAEERIAQAAEGLARDGADKLRAASPPHDPAEQERVRSQFHQAGLAYEQAALARLAENQPEIYWRSAQCYLVARDFRQAVTVLQKYVGVEKIERRLAEAYLAKAEALVALEDRAGAREAFEKCLEYPATPFAFRARYEWALQEIESKDYAKALKILEDNLDSSGPVHDRPAHEKSLFKVAELYHALGQFDKAHIAYSDALVQYPPNSDVPAERQRLATARQRLAQCYQELAKREKEKFDGAKDSTAKANYQATRQDWLVKGAKEFEQLADALEHKAKAGGQPLTRYEEHLLASALLGAADTQYDLGDFHETLRRCEMIQERFRKQAAGLLAFQRIVRLLGVLTQSSEDRRKILTAAAEALKMAKADLAEMPEDSDDFRGQGVYDKPTWQHMVATYETWLNKLNGQPSAP